MQYVVAYRPRSVKDLDGLSPDVAKRVVQKINALADNLHGDVKRLTTHDPEFRLRVGDWRVLFDVEAATVIIYRVLHRSKAYE